MDSKQKKISSYSYPPMAEPLISYNSAIMALLDFFLHLITFAIASKCILQYQIQSNCGGYPLNLKALYVMYEGNHHLVLQWILPEIENKL